MTHVSPASPPHLTSLLIRNVLVSEQLVDTITKCTLLDKKAQDVLIAAFSNQGNVYILRYPRETAHGMYVAMTRLARYICAKQDELCSVDTPFAIVHHNKFKTLEICFTPQIVTLIRIVELPSIPVDD